MHCNDAVSGRLGAFFCTRKWRNTKQVHFLTDSRHGFFHFPFSLHRAGTDRHYLSPLRNIMEKANFFNDLQAKFSQAIENSPAKDLEKNVKAMMTQGFSKLDLVTREEFDIQMLVLAATREKVDLLEARVAELEALVRARP
jgi:BMFP domain-containing protein YqiC